MNVKDLLFLTGFELAGREMREGKKPLSNSSLINSPIKFLRQGYVLGWGTAIGR